MNNLRNIRKSKGLTLDDVANALNLTSTTVSRYEREEHQLTIKMANTFAKYYDVRLIDIFGSVEQQMQEMAQAEEPQLDEMETKMLEKFRKLDFDDKISVLSYINNIINSKNQK